MERITPEEALKRCKKEEEEKEKIKRKIGKGDLKIFVGYSPGVGKTYSMLNEGNDRLKNGENIIIGYVEDHGRKETQKQIKNLKIVPRKKINYKSIVLEEMDVEEILRLKPKTVIVDELAHTNVPGSKNKKRWEDVNELIDNGINVLTTVNIQHIESLNNIIEEITGVKVRETVPDKVFQEADELMVIDLPPEGLINRLKSGKVYRNENIERSLANFFTKGNLTALRELSLRETANEVDINLMDHKEKAEVNDNVKINEKVLVCISSNPKSAKLIRHGARTARRYKCKLYVLIVNCTNPLAKKEQDILSLEDNKKLALSLGAEIVEVKSRSVSKAIVDFSKEENITQIILGHSRRTKFQTMVRGSTINKVLEEADNIEIRVIPYI
ncbi:universal stress protein [Clostridium sp.]|uniref:universal stress protein n=1 Tax=Clostridium sp. TaxID=1506 RepID=UPI0039929838